MSSSVLATWVTPHRAVWLHLLLIGIPYRFGLLPAGFGQGWLFPDYLLADRCIIFASSSSSSSPTDSHRCSEVEAFAIRDFGVRFLLHYELTWIVWLTMRHENSNRYNAAIAFHKLLLGTSFATLFHTTWLQHYFVESAFSPAFYSDVVLYYLAALALSTWILQNQHKPSVPPSMKWSIPGNALWCGAVINLFVAVASFQALQREGGVQEYYMRPVSPVIRICFAKSTFHTLLHAIVLFRIRNFLTMPQLRTICLYKLLVNIATPLFWLPDVSPYMRGVDQRLTFCLRGMLSSTYLFGFLWAGKAEGVSRILSSEKED